MLLDAARRALPGARVLHIFASTELGAMITGTTLVVDGGITC